MGEHDGDVRDVSTIICIRVSAYLTGEPLGPSPRMAVTFADSSTKNMIEHLHDTHQMTKEGPLTIQLEKGQLRIETAFGNTRPQIIFNKDMFRELLLRWLVINNISFRQVEQGSFRILLGYLAACVSISYFFSCLIDPQIQSFMMF